MTIEERLKIALGEMHFQLLVTASQLDEAKKKIAELEAAAASRPAAKETAG